MILRFKDFTELTEEESELVRNMRNADDVRLKMYNQEEISSESHRKWMQTLKTRRDCRYFLVLADGKVTGVVDFTSISADECEWGYYLGEKYLNSGYGLLLEYYVIKYAFEVLRVKKLFCAVLDSNRNVYDTHVKFFAFTPDEKYSSQKERDGKALKFNGLSLERDTWESQKNPFVERTLRFFKVEKVLW